MNNRNPKRDPRSIALLFYQNAPGMVKHLRVDTQPTACTNGPLHMRYVHYRTGWLRRLDFLGDHRLVWPARAAMIPRYGANGQGIAAVVWYRSSAGCHGTGRLHRGEFAMKAEDREEERYHSAGCGDCSRIGNP